MNPSVRRITLAAGLALCAQIALAVPAHYIVFEVDRTGRVDPVYYAQVELDAAAPGQRADATGAQDLRDDDIIYRLQRHSVDLGAHRVRLPQLRGEFARDPGVDGTLVSTRIDAVEPRAFVLRIPLDEADTVSFGKGSTRQAFDLDAIAAGVPDARGVTSAIPVLAPTAVNGSPSNRVDILVIGEGYTSAQQNLFNSNAATFENQFFGVTPYLEYKSFVNWATLFVASSQSGVDHPPYQAGCNSSNCCADSEAQTDPHAGQFVNTAFDGKFCDWQIHRLLTVNDSKVLAAAAAYPDWDEILVVANDTVYGGSGGSVSVTSMNQYASEIILHEYGHTFTGLADEYDTAYPGFPACNDVSGGPPCEANVTNQTNPALVKWKAWLTPGNPIPTPGGTAGVGLFEGARYQSVGMYRPVDQCEMRYLGMNFCPACRQEYVVRLYAGGWGVPAGGIDLIEPGSESPPAAQPVQYAPGTTQTFSIVALRPSVGSLAFEWWLDGVRLSGPSTESHAFTQSMPTPTTRTLQVRVRDTSAYVKPGPLPARTRTWTIQVNADLVFRNGFD